MALAIQVQGLGKQYRIGAKQAGYSTLRETVTETLVRPLRQAGKMLGSRPSSIVMPDNSIWALRDVSFKLTRGEVVGIIGRNGAGKSTLLKILSQITEPSEGVADIYGRVGSLLEVGTGFHPELTGRENVYLNGAILGMSKSEIDRKFDEIVSFAEVDKFVDTPVKHYSSGMCVRLAFAVAAHLEPEILIVDEVLAVGDAAFQKKCLSKMEGVANEGRTVLFVSHNMLAVQNLCHRAIWLHDGRLVEDGPTGEVVSNYLRISASTLTERVWDDMTHAPGNDKVRLRRVSVRGPDDAKPHYITRESPFVIEIELWNFMPNAMLEVTLHFHTEQQIVAFTSASHIRVTGDGNGAPAGLFRAVCHVPGNLLNSLLHRVVLLIVQDASRVIHRETDVVSFDVLEKGRHHYGWHGKEPGVVRPSLKWTVDYVGAGELESSQELRSMPPHDTCGRI
jgi:lipopolysaccharide transport system ATP-binding protein